MLGEITFIDLGSLDSVGSEPKVAIVLKKTKLNFKCKGQHNLTGILWIRRDFLFAF